MDRTLILVKPDAFARGLTGEIVARFERKGLRIAAMKQMTVERDLAERHYAEHAEKPFFGDLVEFITSGPLVAFVLEGYEAVNGKKENRRRGLAPAVLDQRLPPAPGEFPRSAGSDAEQDQDQPDGNDQQPRGLGEQDA